MWDFEQCIPSQFILIVYMPDTYYVLMDYVRTNGLCYSIHTKKGKEDVEKSMKKVDGEHERTEKKTMNESKWIYRLSKNCKEPLIVLKGLYFTKIIIIVLSGNEIMY